VPLLGDSKMSEKTQGSQTRRGLLLGAGGIVAAASLAASAANAAPDMGAPNAQPSGLTVAKADTSVVFIDPQTDVLSEKGTSWEAVGASVVANKTRENMERIFKCAKANGYKIFISPHYFYPSDYHWTFDGTLEALEVSTHTFARSGPLTLVGFPNSGTDWLDRFKPYIEDGETIVVSPHKVWGPQTNDLVLQLRKRKNPEGDPRRHVGEHLRRIPSARAARTGFRDCSGERRHRGTSASGLGRRLSGGIDQLRVPRSRRVVNR
jgi:hypothetical protein